MDSALDKVGLYAMSRSVMVLIPSCFEALTKGFVMKKEIKGIQEH